MTKAISAFLILAMIVQLIKPLGLPGESGLGAASHLR